MGSASLSTCVHVWWSRRTSQCSSVSPFRAHAGFSQFWQVCSCCTRLAVLLLWCPSTAALLVCKHYTGRVHMCTVKSSALLITIVSVFYVKYLLHLNVSMCKIHLKLKTFTSTWHNLFTLVFVFSRMKNRISCCQIRPSLHFTHTPAMKLFGPESNGLLG